jgi:guanine deaminase
MTSSGILTGIRGHLIDAPRFGELRSVTDGAIIIEDGLIAESGSYAALAGKPRPQPVNWRHSAGVVVFPGLIDIHAHIPQYPAVARGQSELLPWLERHIFPLERDFTGPKARREVAGFFEELARHGTTTAMLYAAIFEDTCDAAFEAAQRLGLRAIIGKMMMDVGSYGDLQPRKILSTSLQESARLCKKWHRSADGLLDYAFAPRFAVSCSRELMEGAAALAREHGAFIQTHLAENTDECRRVGELFPDACDYTDVYEKCGLLTERTVLGHCIHLSEREIETLRGHNCVAAHCPTANFFLGSGIMKLDRLRAAGLRIGLGSDVAAGPELNLWQVMRSAVEAQKARAFYEPGVAPLTTAGALHLATQGAADALGKGALIGSLEIGKEADLTIMDIPALLPGKANAKSRHDLVAGDIVSLCVHRGGPHAVLETVVRGRSVHRASERVLF